MKNYYGEDCCNKCRIVVPLNSKRIVDDVICDMCFYKLAYKLTSEIIQERAKAIGKIMGNECKSVSQ